MSIYDVTISVEVTDSEAMFADLRERFIEWNIPPEDIDGMGIAEAVRLLIDRPQDLHLRGIAIIDSSVAEEAD